MQARHARPEAGFTLIEAMVAVAILGFGLLTLAMMQLEAISQGAAGRHSADAAAIARTYLEQVQRLPWSELDTAEAAGTWVSPAWPGATGTVDVEVDDPAGSTAVNQSYDVNWRVTDVLDGMGNPNPCLRDVEVRVSWDEEDMSNDKILELVTRRFNWGDASC